MNKRRLVLLLTAVFLCFTALAQNRPVSGTVYDFDGTPMIGVSVVVPGSQRGTVTDENGRWTLSAAPGETLQFWFVGYDTLEEVVSPEGTVKDVQMVITANVLDDVIVVGYGAVKKSDLPVLWLPSRWRPYRICRPRPWTVYCRAVRRACRL